MAFVLLAGSGLLIRTLWGILRVDPGFDATHVLTFRVYRAQPARTAGQSAAHDALFPGFVARLRSLPGVSSVSCATFVLFPDEMYKVPFAVEGQSAAPSDQRPFLTHAEAGPDFFRTMGISFLRGREFSAADSTKNAPPVAIINQAMARRYWPNDDSIGKRFKFADPNFKSPWFSIVGVVGDVREQGLENAAEPMAFVPTAGSMGDDIVVRTTGDPAALSATLRREVRLLDADLVITHMSAANSTLEQRETHREFTTCLFGGFALIAVVLAAVGIYGTLAFWVSQRTQEIGVRMALGAKKSEALRRVVRQGFGLAFLGIAYRNALRALG